MKFIMSKDSREGENKLYKSLSSHLKLGKVLWIVAGGSNIEITVRIMAKINRRLSSNLYLLLSDERYGEEGHKDSNFKQLLSGGLDKKEAHFSSMLQSNSSPEL